MPRADATARPQPWGPGQARVGPTAVPLLINEVPRKRPWESRSVFRSPVAPFAGAGLVMHGAGQPLATRGCR